MSGGASEVAGPSGQVGQPTTPSGAAVIGAALLGTFPFLLGLWDLVVNHLPGGRFAAAIFCVSGATILLAGVAAIWHDRLSGRARALFLLAAVGAWLVTSDFMGSQLGQHAGWLPWFPAGLDRIRLAGRTRRHAEVTGRRLASSCRRSPRHAVCIGTRTARPLDRSAARRQTGTHVHRSPVHRHGRALIRSMAPSAAQERQLRRCGTRLPLDDGPLYR